jgi:glucuronate isomerase
MAFIHDNFLLETEAARTLYHQHAGPQAIIDYHCHLSPREIAEDRRFANLFEIWLEGDHYKWRAMRANGVAETYCTGDADPRAKFEAWAATVPRTLRNPLYHWTHLELTRYFGITDLLDASSAGRIWDAASEQLRTPEFTARGILRRFRVEVVCTTDDPADDLGQHHRIAQSDLPTRVLPTFRPDRALDVHRPDVFNPWLDRLAAAANVHLASLNDLLDALRARHAAFHEAGGRLSDHGLDHCHATPCSQRVATRIFEHARAGQTVSEEDHQAFASFMMLFFGRLDAEKGWTKQLHLGARRNNSSRGLQRLGRDTGFDSIGDWPQIDALAQYLDRLDREGALPKTILYNLNPADNYAFATMAGNFQDASAAGKIQFGSGWWFLDQKEGMEWQMNALSHIGLLSRFVGMTTDSRSFMSYPRHEYFRRVLCNLVGRDIERGEIPRCESLTAPLIEDVCYRNAKGYFGF